MTARPRLCLIQRAFVALFVAIFLPLSGSAAACQLSCILASSGTSHLSPLGTGALQAESPHSRHERPHHPSARHLSHGSLCHVTVAPTLLADLHHTLPPAVDIEWTEAHLAGFRSCVWPPPEHRPRI